MYYARCPFCQGIFKWSGHMWLFKRFQNRIFKHLREDHGVIPESLPERSIVIRYRKVSE